MSASVVPRLGILAFAVIGLIAIGESPATASDVSCGDTIKKDTKLDRDLVNCPSNGLLIGADGVTLNLNGHTIDGDGELVKDCPRNEPCDVGVEDFGRNGVTIKGGKIREFGFGVLVIKAKDSRLHRVSSSRNHFNGITIFVSSGIRVEESAATRNGLETDFPGLAMFDSNENRIVGNTLSGNADLGLFARNVDDSLIEDNKMARNHELGAIIEGDGNEVDGNRIRRSGGGIALEGDENTVTRNRISSVRFVGISLEGGNENLVADNDVRGSDRDGILVGAFGRRGRDNEVIGNQVRGVDRDGLRVAAKATETLLEDNQVSGSGDDGIEVKVAATTLAGNEATDNDDLGIEAVAGVIDAGGNTASGNGNPAQCTNVACAAP